MAVAVGFVFSLREAGQVSGSEARRPGDPVVFGVLSSSRGWIVSSDRPQRVKGRPWCPECGMSIGHHWPGCSKPEWRVGTDSPDSALRARLLRREACDQVSTPEPGCEARTDEIDHSDSSGEAA